MHHSNSPIIFLDKTKVSDDLISKRKEFKILGPQDLRLKNEDSVFQRLLGFLQWHLDLVYTVDV